MTLVWKIDAENPDPAILAEAAKLIRAGKLVAMPTETVYGLAANALNESAVRSIFAAKGRPSTNPLIVHIESEADVKRVAASFPDEAKRLAAKFWPGPLSIVLPKGPDIPDIVTAGGPTVAVRCPDHVVARGLIRAAGVPLAAPSANLSSELSPTRAEHVLKSMDERIDLILDAGPCRVGIESTVVEINETGVIILRPGTNIDEISAFMENKVLIEVKFDGVQFRSPGQMKRHYSPKTPIFQFPKKIMEVLLAKAEPKSKYAIIYFSDTNQGWIENEKCIKVYLPKDQQKCAPLFYDTLHRLDELNLQCIFIENDANATGMAIRDRINRGSMKIKS